MKKRILALLLCGSLLAGAGAVSVAVAAGGEDDPLISRSYIAETFLPRVASALKEIAARAADSRTASAASVKILRLAAGQRAVLGAGQQFLLLSGGAEVTVESGALIDVTVGAAAESGGVLPYHRCIVCEDSLVFLNAAEDSVLKVSAGVETAANESPFADVRPGDWFYADVVGAVRRGLVNGMTPETYEPAGTLTAAQCVKLAACMHQLWHEGVVTLANAGEGPWYRAYADYALEHGIIDAVPPDTVITRANFTGMFYRALPASAYVPVNEIPEGSIPDVPPAEGMDHVPEIYAFYRAGILTGYTDTEGFAEHAFGPPEATISRAEVAAIMNRMFDETARVRFSMG